MNLDKQKIWNYLILAFISYLFFTVPKFFYGDSLFFLELFKDNNWNLFGVLIDWYSIYGFYRFFGIIILYLFYLISFGNIYILLLFQFCLFVFVVWQFSKFILKDSKLYYKSIFFISCFPLSNIILLQPISFHQLIATSILIIALKDYYKTRTINDALDSIQKNRTLLLILLSLFIYELAVTILVIVLGITFFNGMKNKNKLIIAFFSIFFISLITINDKTLNFPEHEHLLKSFFFQISRYFFYAVYFFKYCISVFIENYLNVINVSLFIFISIFFIYGKKISGKIAENHQINNILVLITLVSVWLFYPLFYSYIHIPSSNTIFTYSLFLLPPIFFIYKKNVKYYNLLFCIFFILNQAVFVTHTKEIIFNNEKSKEIIKSLNPLDSYKTIIIEDCENQKYFRRYSNKFSTLNNMITYNFPNTIKPRIFLSSQIRRNITDEDVVVKLKGGRVIVKDNISNDMSDSFDIHSINIYNYFFGFSYQDIRMKLNKILTK